MLACFSAVTTPIYALQQSSEDEKKSSPSVLTIGSDAPSLEISDWVSKGKFEEVTDFNRGKVYVIEFWATWCGPCIASMPQISELQAKYKDQGVQVISVSDESLEKVEKFLERKVKGLNRLTVSSRPTIA